MISMIFAIILMIGLFSIGLRITGAILAAVLWLVVKVPVAIFLAALGAVFCCTLILMPVGLKLIALGVKLFLPFV